MAEFCKACSIKTFGEDFKELAGITQQEYWDKGQACTMICEGCGPIQVDPAGNCVSKDCMCQGEEGHALPWVAQ